ncbi:MAG TPA: ATP-binding protein [Streptosporangiaceae bacterium]|nr:ATP-binding protein [Streptosporangiaceae bacterium]
MGHGKVMNPIRVPASVNSLGQVADYVRKLGQLGNLRDDASYRLHLAADEIVTNIIMHGFREGPGEIEIRGGVTDAQVWLRIVDDAPPFDPRTINHEPRPATIPPAERKLGGLGIFLAFTAVDDFEYESKDGLNINTLKMLRFRVGRCDKWDTASV